MKFFRKIRSLFQKRKHEAAMAAEMQAHLAALTERNLAAGLSSDEARYAALRTFGGVEQIKERARTERQVVWLENRLQDFRYALRQLRKSPGFSLTVIVTFALGIGASCAIFTVVDAVLLRAIPLPESDRLVVLQETNPHYALRSVSPASYQGWSEQADVFEDMALCTYYSCNLTGTVEPMRVRAAGVTGSYFDVLHTQPLFGRGFGPAEDRPGKNDVVVLSHPFWQRTFGGRRDVIGTGIRLDNRLFTILGVMPATFRSNDAEVFTPLGLEAAWWSGSQRMFSSAIARLKPGMTVEQARAQMKGIATRQAERHPAQDGDWSVAVTPLLDFETQAVRPALRVLLAAVGGLLLIACANIGNLLFVRATTRHREIAVRMALGAGRARISAQLLTETLVLALLGGALGVALAKWGVDGLLATVPFELPRACDIALDGRVLGFTLAAVLASGLSVGLIAAWGGTRVTLLASLQGGGQRTSEGRSAGALRKILVVTQVALTLVLLSVAGLLVSSVARLLRADPGFDPRDTLSLWVQPRYKTAAAQAGFVDAVTARFKALPGVTAVGTAGMVPFQAEAWTPRLLDIDGRNDPAVVRPGAYYFRVNPDYFDAMGIRLLRGRGFREQDDAKGLPVAVISRSLAERFFPGEDPLGHRLRWDNQASWRTIVGVVGEVSCQGFGGEILPQIYEPFAQSPSGIVTFVIRGESAAAVSESLLRYELHAVDPALPIFRLVALDQLVKESFARQRFASTIVTIFCVAAMLLVATGIYGVMAYIVVQRTREFGIRVALGAQARELRRLVGGYALRLVGLGLVLGWVGAALTAVPLTRALLYRTDGRDPRIYILSTLVLAAIALLASWLPARRAAKVDPMVALRCE